ncbi:hypothetical protein GCM10007269_19560 [Microbacterium murale]|uniref:Uncharacterized protein n=1 Tax=Microbacterium murale TaxID=1081040 RepID=A0ABQ1RRK4_9MICO|nr:hypothetical protein GCM10007269_19560 [Microbacterium murale]
MSSSASKSGEPLTLGEIRESRGGFAATFDDADRAKFGVEADTRDCGVRAIAIVTGRDYPDVRDSITADLKRRRIRKDDESVDSALRADTVLNALGSGWEYCEESHTFHAEILRKARTRTLIVFIDDHFSAVVDGTIRDTRDHSGSEVSVQGYFRRANAS